KSGDIEGGVDKDMKLSGVKGYAQDFLQIGDRTTTPLGTSLIQSLATPVDRAFTGTNSQMFVDAITGTPATTLYNDLLTWKIMFKLPVVAKWTATIDSRY